MIDQTRTGNLSDLREAHIPDDAFRVLMFDTMVKLVAQRTGDDAFLGNTTALAIEAFRKSLIGRRFPNFWMEVPLCGNPGFDLHVYYDRGQVEPGERFDPGCGFGMQALFDWYFGVETGGVGIGFAHDLRDGSEAVGAYVNFNRKPLDDRRGFLSSLGADESYGCMSELLARLPRSWHPWYLGLFPGRTDAGVRVGAFVSSERQSAYAADTHALADDLSQAGFTAFDDTMLERISKLAATPFTLELQLDATEGGVGDTLGVDLTMRRSSSASVSASFKEGAPAWKACELLESWGVADSRWHLISEASMARLIPMGEAYGNTLLALGCTPAFIKAKWTATQPQSAKVYFQCTSRLLEFHSDAT